MALYCVGDIQGCDHALSQLLSTIDFSPSRDTIYLLGDLVNRGPASADVLRRCMAHDGAIQALLGNHDLHLLAVAHGARTSGKRDTLHTVLQADDSAKLLDWLQQQPLAIHRRLHDDDMLMVHAGVLPSWTVSDTMRYASEVQSVLRSSDHADFWRTMYGNTPAAWNEALTGDARLRCIVNALTRLRFCSPDGQMDFDSSESADQAPAGLIPWFQAPQRATARALMVFGHWSRLGLLNQPQLLGMDTGCVWGGQLSAVRLGTSIADRAFFQVPCCAAQNPLKSSAQA